MSGNIEDSGRIDTVRPIGRGDQAVLDRRRLEQLERDVARLSKIQPSPGGLLTVYRDRAGLKMRLRNPDALRLSGGWPSPSRLEFDLGVIPSTGPTVADLQAAFIAAYADVAVSPASTWLPVTGDQLVSTSYIYVVTCPWDVLSYTDNGIYSLTFTINGNDYVADMT